MHYAKKWNYLQNLGYKTTWQRYLTEYTLAVENLIQRSEMSQATVLALPVLYLMRHSLELAFKLNLLELEQISGDKAKIDYSGKTAHVLLKLHQEFERQTKLIFDHGNYKEEILKEFKIRNQELRAFRTIFDKLDNWSYAFRYPVQNDGVTKSFNKTDEINITGVIPIYEAVQPILKYTSLVLLDPTSKNSNSA